MGALAGYVSDPLPPHTIFLDRVRPGVSLTHVPSLSVCVLMVLLFNLLYSLLLAVNWKMEPETWMIQGECFTKITMPVILGPLYSAMLSST